MLIVVMMLMMMDKETVTTEPSFADDRRASKDYVKN